MTGYLVVYITVPSSETGEKIVNTLVEKRLAAGASIVPGLSSVYHWQGKICNETELLLIAKTRDSLFERLEQEVKSIHPYQVPEIIALPIIKGSREYLDWIDESTSP